MSKTVELIINLQSLVLKTTEAHAKELVDNPNSPWLINYVANTLTERAQRSEVAIESVEIL